VNLDIDNALPVLKDDDGELKETGILLDSSFILFKRLTVCEFELVFYFPVETQCSGNTNQNLSTMLAIYTQCATSSTIFPSSAPLLQRASNFHR
jgi:hypothetical protein